MLRVISANLNGIRSAESKGFFSWIAEINADIVCIQELKAQEYNLNSSMCMMGDLKGWFHFAERKGYSGVGIYARRTPDRVTTGIGVKEFDDEGRYVRADFGNLSVISLYLPSGSASEDRQASKFRFLNLFYPFSSNLIKEGKEIIICGDWNIAHREIDLKNWKSNQKNSGFLPEEREWLSRLFEEQGWVDVYRSLYPDAGGEGYTWWSNRGQAWAKNVGWRIDYQIATPATASLARSAFVYKELRFSDHAPLIVDYAVGF